MINGSNAQGGGRFFMARPVVRRNDLKHKDRTITGTLNARFRF